VSEIPGAGSGIQARWSPGPDPEEWPLSWLGNRRGALVGVRRFEQVSALVRLWPPEVTVPCRSINTNRRILGSKHLTGSDDHNVSKGKERYSSIETSEETVAPARSISENKIEVPEPVPVTLSRS
jgi:hypothetical protein